ncbi:carbohydrate ABC transporter permease [Frondihabitans australicus]|uniref:Carbohydrate ABC transporter membrane protein 2 (CUT1 family) n=1 Tax=Frondihabitans australicus TaxID=386892 RepID=A0A495IFI5_9MICO|nr:carbohydrate ABC transporter permease [Frondihabitans australicus]RKR73955.1 carbohydrate ABC transporter membrane protein 2 (CUT1 family) [Frondihabitans australicus]
MTTRRGGAWARFGLLAIVTALVLVPIAATFRSLVGAGAGVRAFLPFVQGAGLTWFGNSLAVSLSTVAVAVLVGAPAGYVLTRGRSRAVSGYALVVFVLQAFPLILTIVPLFVLFAGVGLVDSLPGVAVVYVGMSISAAVWMMASAIASVPVALEEAAWLDGCSIAGGFWRIVMRNSLPGVLSAAVFTFLLSWNDYLVALVFLRSQQNYTLAIGLEAAGHSPALALLMSLPPVVLFLVFQRHLRFGGVAGSFGGI